MSIDAFILGFAGIVIGLGVSDLLASFHRLLRAAARVKWDWLALSFAALTLFLSVVFWWFSLGWYQGATSVTIAEFLPKLLFLCLSFLMLAAALPDEVPESGLDLRGYYLASRRHIWSLVSILVFFNIAFLLFDYWQLGLIAVAGIIWPTVISGALAVASAISARTWLHAVAIAWIACATSYYSLLEPVTAS